MKKRLWGLVLVFLATVIFSFSSYAASGTWKSDSNGWWYEYSNGSYAQGWVQIGSDYYYFDNSGYMAGSEYRDGYWLNGNGTWNVNYQNAHWDHDSIGWWYTDSSGWYPVSQWIKIDGSYYYFKDNGYLATNEYIDGSYVGSDGAWIKDYTPPAETPTETPSESTTTVTPSTDNNNSSSSVSGDTTVYVSTRSNTIHKYSSCSGMKHYRSMTYDEAVSHGYKKCGICWE